MPNHGIYEVYSRRGNSIVYYSYFGKEGFYKVTKNVVTGFEKRKSLRYAWNKPPKFLISKENGGTKYNYFEG